MRLRTVVTMLVLLAGLAGSPAWAYWGGVNSVDDKVDALVTIEVLPRYAEVRLDGALLGSALEIASRGLPVYGSRAYTVHISAPGHLPRTLTLVANSSMPQRVFVDLVPIRKP